MAISRVIRQRRLSLEILWFVFFRHTRRDTSGDVFSSGVAVGGVASVGVAFSAKSDRLCDGHSLGAKNRMTK